MNDSPGDSDLVFEEDGRIEVGNFWVDGFANDFTFARVEKGAHFFQRVRRGTLYRHRRESVIPNTEAGGP